MKQQALTLIVEERTVKGTAGETVREWEQDRNKDWERTKKKKKTRARRIKRIDKQKDPNLPTEQHGEEVRVSKPSPSFLKSFPKLLLLITGRFGGVIPLHSPHRGKENLLGIMGRVFRHSLIHFCTANERGGGKKITFLCVWKGDNKAACLWWVFVVHYSFGAAVDWPIWNSNQLLDEDLGTTWQGGRKGPVVPNTQSDQCNLRERKQKQGNAETVRALIVEIVLCRSFAHG